MKKILAVLTSFCICLSLAGCMGESNVEDATVATEEKIVEENYVPVDFSGINIGCDPNNMLSSIYAPGFDENYIYYNDAKENGMYRINYAGEGKKLLTEGDNTCINVYGDYIYYVYDADYVMEVYRIDRETLEQERVMMDDGYNNRKIEVFSMLVWEDVILYAYKDGDAHAAMAYNMETEELTSLVADWDDVELMAISTDGESAFIHRLYPSGKGDVHKVALKSIKADNEVPDGMGDVAIAELIGEETNIDKGGIFTRDGYMWIEDGKYVSLSGYESVMGDSNAGECNSGWILGEDVMLLKANAKDAPAEVYFAKDMDFAKVTKLCDTAYRKYENRAYVWNTYGVYNDKLYVIERADSYDEDMGEMLTVIDKKGNCKQYSIKNEE